MCLRNGVTVHNYLLIILSHSRVDQKLQKIKFLVFDHYVKIRTLVVLTSFHALLCSVPFKPSHAINSPSGVQTLVTRNVAKSFCAGIFLLLRGCKVFSAFSELTAAFILF